MDNLFIRERHNAPEIKFDAKTGDFKIAGRAHPENADTEFEKVIDWVEKYIKNPAHQTTIVIDLEYFNSTSAKILMRILELLTFAKDKTDLKIKWYYYDEDTYETALDFREIIEYDIEYFDKT